jgi:hypothetical protein
MAQHDYVIDNQSGLAFRQDLNNALAAGVSLNSGASAPSTTYAYQLWADTTAGVLKQRNGANNAWVTIGTLGSANLGLLPAATAASTYAPLTGTGASGTWPISISGNAATATTATTATTLTGTGSLSALDYSYTADFPSVRPSLLLDFANSKALDPRMSFSRASTATYVGANGLIKTAAINEPRFDHNPSTGESLGLLIEEARTNLQTYSEQFDNAAWTKSNTTITANAATAPDGSSTADRLLETAVTGTFYAQGAGPTTPGTYTATVYAKGDGSGRLLNLTFGQSGGYRQAYFNLSTGVASNVDGSLTASIQALPNNWYRCSITGTSSSSSTLFIFSAATAGDNSVYANRAGSASAGLYIWGAQLEAASFPTSYIPTVAATVTRSADVAQMTGTNFSSWYNSTNGSLVSIAQTPSGVAWTSAQLIGGFSNAVYAQGAGGYGLLVAGFYSSNVWQSSGFAWNNGSSNSLGGYLNFGANNYTLQNRFGFMAWSPTESTFGINGALASGSATTAAGTVAGFVDRFIISGNSIDSNYLPPGSVLIKRIAFYSARLTNAQLQNLTAS